MCIGSAGTGGDGFARCVGAYGCAELVAPPAYGATDGRGATGTIGDAGGTGGGGGRPGTPPAATLSQYLRQ